MRKSLCSVKSTFSWLGLLVKQSAGSEAAGFTTVTTREQLQGGRGHTCDRLIMAPGWALSVQQESV